MSRSAACSPIVLPMTGDPAHPLDPFGRVEPAVARLDEPSGFQGYSLERLASSKVS